MATQALTATIAPAARRQRPVAIWLFVCAALIFTMVVIGGITRLTESGLSITEWKPVTGALPPLSDGAWQEEFAKYRQTDQYRLINRGMSLEDFKSIFWWEFVHRLWGRLIGVAFFVPYVWFLATGRVRGTLARRLAGIFVLGALQGALGWYMVMSGLADRVDVSPYRLTAHLGLAVLIYAAILFVALDLIRPRNGTASMAALALATLVFCTMMSGGFVAGLDAGMTYNTFPLMDGRIVPRGYLDLSPAWRNLFENIAAVQFNHRVLGMATLVAAFIFWWRHRASGRVSVTLVPVAALAQAALGISTLLLVVPIPLAALHQAGAMTLLTVVLVSAQAMRRP